MILLLDVGNSRLKWATAESEQLQFGGSLVHGGDPAAGIEQLPAHPVNAVWVANVTGNVLGDSLAAALQQRYGKSPQFARVCAERGGLRCAYAEPGRLGVDRWLCLLATWTRRRGAACVASAGTALTFDAVDSGGQHLGGTISPGLRAAQQAVLGSTRFAAAAPLDAYEEGLGRDTDACVRQGALHSAAGLLDRLSSRHGVSAPCYLTGGDAALLAPHLAGTWEQRPHLVLEGLLVLAGGCGK